MLFASNIKIHVRAVDKNCKLNILHIIGSI